MSGSELTSGQAARRDSWQAADSFHVNQVSTFEEDRPPTSSKSPSEILSDVYRGIRKAIPTREDSFKIGRAPSRLALKAFNPNSTPFPPRHHSPLQHARGLSLQNSLEKPLPAPPAVTSPVTPQPSATNAESYLQDIVDSDIEEAAPMESRSNSRSNSRNNSRNNSRSNTMDSNASLAGAQMYNGGLQDMSGRQSSAASYSRNDGGEGQKDSLTPRSNGPLSAGPSPPVASWSRAPPVGTAVGTPSTSGSSAHLSGLMCNVHRTTGREPHPLVGATTTIVGDKLYVFGGRILSRSRPAPLTSDLYELDLIRRHWTKLETTGDVPPPRYFHSMCALGDTKLVCYGGMSPTTSQPTSASQDQQPEVTVMSDIYIYDVPTKKWTYIPSQDAPQGRYAHCACILPSSATFSSHKAPLSALQHNPSSGNPNEGRIGINIDGAGGAEMIVVGGQDGANHYIEQISVFNLRSLKWTSTQPLEKSCGAYRSVVASLPPSVTARIGKAHTSNSRQEGGISQEAKEPGSSMLIYSNYNFLDVKLELQVRGSDGSLAEKPMSGSFSPPGLRFPNGGVIDTYFVVSGTYLTSSKQEYALWALDLRSLTWSRIDAGGSVFSQGSWNRGILWNRRNTFVILGNRKRSLVDDYNHRRINFSNVCMVELEAFGFYDNPRKTTPMAGLVSASSPFTAPGLSLARKAGWTAGGRYHSRAAEELGEKALALRELADMDILCIGGERIPINSRIVGRRWGPYFVQLLREGAATQDGSDSATLRTGMSSQAGARMSTMTITQSNRNTGDSSSLSMASTLGNASSAGSMKPPSTAGTSVSGSSGSTDASMINAAPTPASLPPNTRPRCLYLPHTYLTIQALLHFLYTSSLPPPSSSLCTPQILCSLLQIARPYKIDGLLEAVVERLHALLDSRNAAAVFNATAMAAGGGRGIDGSMNPNFFMTADSSLTVGAGTAGGSRSTSVSQPGLDGATGGMRGLRINTSVPGHRAGSDELSASTSASGSEWSSELGDSERGAIKEIWSGELSSVIGLQKRGLRGLMEGRRMRATVDRERDGGRGERQAASDRFGQRVGLGIAGS
ncbi:Uu.00g025530.m01.CDS01 [Anthostomella pinea]|uniref:Uu.00g025530.m01.CDS01 n=1 Tax=Anthostomella pinea TaxID=933095 RepID=A0AAI8V7D8_9PEZI|nr:Uu.00g025530.m01.CDS01 [Anthostomella pinea]